MVLVSILAVFGSTGAENKLDKFQKLFYDGLISALASHVLDVDAVVATSSPIPSDKKFGTTLIHALSSGANLRALFQPTLQQFQTAFDETIAEAVSAVGSGVRVVAVVYAGQVLHCTGEWLLADSTFSGEQLQMWLNSDVAATWQPEIQKLTSAPLGTEPIQIVVCTPSAGAKTRWPTAATTPGGGTELVMLSKSRRLPVRLQTTASWRMNGRLVATRPDATTYEALQALSHDLARLHCENQSNLLATGEQEFTLAQTSFKDAPPALYLLPSGRGGVQTQSCGLFVVHGVNVLLGSAYTNIAPPQWWQLVRHLDRLDTAVFPDWSAASIQSCLFLTKHLLSATSTSYAANWLGCLFTPALAEPGVESPLLLTPPSSNAITADPHRLHHLPTQTEKIRLFYKIGVGELSLHCLGVSVGVLLVWHPAAGLGKASRPLTIFLPVVQPPDAATPPGSLLVGLVRVVRKVLDTVVGVPNAPATVTPQKKSLTSTLSKQQETLPLKGHANGMIKQVTPLQTKPLPSKPLTMRTPSSRPPVSNPIAASRTTPSATSRVKLATTTTAASRPSTAASRLGTSTTPRANTTPSKTSTITREKPNPQTKKSLPEMRPTPASRTQAKLVEHAAKVAKVTSSKPGHELKYSPAGRPTNLPPRRNVGEKTVMEELNEAREEVTKTPAPDSHAEAVKQLSSGHETDEEASYCDSLHAKDEEMEVNSAKSPIDIQHHEVHNDVSIDFATTSAKKTKIEDDGVHQKVNISTLPSKAESYNTVITSKSLDKSGVHRSREHVDFTKPDAGIEHDKGMELKFSTSPVCAGLAGHLDSDRQEEFALSTPPVVEDDHRSREHVDFTKPDAGIEHDEGMELKFSTSPVCAGLAGHLDSDRQEEFALSTPPVVEDVHRFREHMDFKQPVASTEHDYELTCKFASVLKSSENEFDPMGNLASGMPSASVGDRIEGTSCLHPPTTLFNDDFPVHEVNWTSIPEAADHIDTSDFAPHSMPPIHNDLMYQCTSQPADSTTSDAQHFGVVNLDGDKPGEENVHSPSSDVSNDSVIHAVAGASSTGRNLGMTHAPQTTAAAVTSLNSESPSGFSTEHPLRYNPRQPEDLDGECEADSPTSYDRKSPIMGGMEDVELANSKPSAHGTNGFTNGTASVEESSDSSAPIIDPLGQWGHPQGMPAPVAPSTGAMGKRVQTSRPTTSRPTASGSKTATSATDANAPDTLPPGAPLQMDVVWVPGYIVRVPFAMATQFFTQIRARVYVLSGECLDPITGEALIAGISKWTPEEREVVMRMSCGRGVEGINVVPTDEPLEWVRWLRRSGGGSGDGSGTGEQRLQAAGLTVHSSATLCDIHFCDDGKEITCPGTQLSI